MKKQKIMEKHQLLGIGPTLTLQVFFFQTNIPKLANKKLEKEYEIKNIYILRHPLENFFSINSLKILNNKIPLDFFLKSYSLFFKEAAKDRTYSYEKFTLDPDKDLRKICNNIEIEFDKKYLNDIGNIEITGDHKAISSNAVLPSEDKIMKFINEEILLKIK